MSKRLILRREELYPVYMEGGSFSDYDIVVSDEFYERYTKAMSEFSEVQDQLENVLLNHKLKKVLKRVLI